MAEPKKRTNNAKQGMRRMHQRILSPTIIYCSKCHSAKVRHNVCQNCGYYKEVKVLEER